MAARGILSQLVDLARAVASAARSTPPASPGERPAPTARAPRTAQRRAPGGRPEPAPRAPTRPATRPATRTAPSDPLEADGVTPSYAPQRDGEPDPGEVVWAWVPYEEDASRGKDRPVLVLSVDERGSEVVALMLTSKDHAGPTARDAADELRRGRRWMDVGTGGWDAQGRPSEVRLDRVLRLPADAVRREGAALDARVFQRVAAAASELHGWR